ncbi:hypothetical protein Zmor_003328 [Zophobas morio]|uniref:DUF2428 domain-containing protein n=1 Tax=Zophobas morio TaxID=2755281 RepID=A0AA38HMN2_9CUCU|nr:hypothetical protein Zmor_003328 [Zophobas morio]
MGLVEIFSTLNMAINHEHEELISLLTYLAHQPVETIVDIESTTKMVSALISQLFDKDFENKFLNMLHNLNDCNQIHVSNNNNVFKIHIRDTFVFKFLLIVSLKYRKSLFIQSNSTKRFVQTLVEEILKTIDILKYQSSYLLRFLEMILRKREDVLTPDLSLLILQNMNKAAFSPLTGFKNCAQNVSRLILRSLPHATKKYLCNFNNLPIKGIDLNDILKHCEEKEIRIVFTLINKQILKLFCNNTDSRDGSFYYKAITSICNFDEFVEEIWPHYSHHFQNFDEGEFYQSFLKYWIPITVKEYKSDFYTFIAEKDDVDFQLKAYTLLETRKNGFYDNSFDLDTFNFLKYAKTSHIGLKIVCTYLKKQMKPDDFELNAALFYLNHYSHSEFPDEVLKTLKHLFSQIFLNGHMNLYKSDLADVQLHLNFLTSVYRFCGRILNGVNYEVSAQLLKLVWDVASGSSSVLVTCFKIDRENAYEVGGNLLYQKLLNTGFWGDTFGSLLLVNCMESLLVREFKYCPKLIQVVKERYLDVINLESLSNMTKLLEVVSETVCLQSSEKIRAYADLIVSYKKLQVEDIVKLCHIFENTVHNFDPPSMFVCVLILDILAVVITYDDINVNALIEKSLDFFANIFDDDLSSGLNTKDYKVLESLINNVIECLTLSKSHWSELNKERLLDHLCKIIQRSNMKRPVSLAANFVNFFGSSMESDEDKTLKIKLLDRTLRSLYHNKQSGKIRRNPETRLVIHALCLSDKNLNKPFLVSSLNFMLEVLSNPLSSDSTLSSTLHSLEVLVSDNSIHQYTLSFIVDIIKHCIRLFNKPSWIVRNADLQLMKSLIERFLGVSLDEITRPKTIEDLFMLFPSLVSHFYEVLSKKELNDSAILVLLFFSESQIKNDVFVQTCLGRDFEKFRHLFVRIMKNYSNNAGFLAIRAFTSLCPSDKIPSVFSEVVYYIQREFVHMDKNVFANLIKLLQELDHKYKSSLVRTREGVISRAVDALVNYLKPFNCLYFNLLSVRLCTVEDLSDKIVASLTDEIDYKKRIWLNNYIPFVVAEIGFAHLGILLNRILQCHLPEFLQIRILSILVDKSTHKSFPATAVLKVLVLKLATLSDDQTFLIMAYSKTILLIYEFTRDLSLSSDLIAQIRQDFQTECIYKVFIYVLALARSDFKTNDEVFLKKWVKKYVDAIDQDEVLVDLSITITHLYGLVSTEDRYVVIKLIFYLLLNESTSFEMCKFVSSLTNSHCSSVLVSLVNLLNCENLMSYVGEKTLVFKLLFEFYDYVDSLSDDLVESDTYYLIENDCSLPKRYIKMIILKSLSACTTRSAELCKT